MPSGKYRRRGRGNGALIPGPMTSTYIDALESVLRSPSSGRDPDLKTALSRLSTEIRARLLRGSDSSVSFIEASVRSLTRVRGSSNAVLRMTCLCDSGQYLFSNGRPAEALIAGAHCEALARQVENKDFLSKAQTLQAMANAELGNVGQAVVQCSSALDIAIEIDHFTRQISVLVNLGIALNYGGLYREAIPCFDRVLGLLNSPRGAEEVDKLGAIGKEFALCALTNKAQSFYELGLCEDGFLAIDQCLRQSGEPVDALTSERRAIREFTCVQLALELGKLATAREHARLCRHYGLGANQRADFHAKVAIALCEVHGGNAERGLDSLERLLPESKAAAHRLTVLDSLIRSYEQMGRPELALERMQEVIVHMHAQRDAGIAAVLAVGPSLQASRLSRSRDLDNLAIREAILREKVTERKLATERIEMFERFAVAADLKEDASGKHGYRVGRLSGLLARRLDWPASSVGALEMTARLHDIGKIAVPDNILSSSQRLGEVDRRFITAHAMVGGELLSNSNMPQLRVAEEIARHHHEWWDGTGYPAKLSGKRIPIHARIVALADVFDALTHGRPYAPAWPIDRALEEIRQRRGTQFDPDLTDAFLALVDDLRREHSDLDAFLGEASRNSPFLQARDKIRIMLEGERQAENIAAAAAETVH